MDALATLAPPLRFLPAEAPLDMPVQDLRARPERAVVPPPVPPGVLIRRALLVIGTLLLTAAGTREMALALDVRSAFSIEAVVLALFVPLFAWIAMSFVSSLLGFASLIGRGGTALGIATDGPLPAPGGPTALLLPVYNEDPTRVMATLEAMLGELRDAGAAEAFQAFILSDTTDPDAWVREEAAYLVLRDRLPAGTPVF